MSPRTPQEIRNAIKAYEKTLKSFADKTATPRPGQIIATKIMIQRLQAQHATLTRPCVRKVYDRATY